MRYVVRIIFSLVGLCIFHAHGQQTGIRFGRLGPQDGLSQNSVSSILQDHKGFLWFGTRDGLNKYDGYKFSIYKRDLSQQNSLASNNIRALAEDNKDILWIGTWDGGLDRYDPVKDIVTHFRSSASDSQTLSSDRISCLLPDHAGKIWIGTENGGLNRLDPMTGKITRIAIGHPSVTALLQTNDEHIWVGTPAGIYRLDSRTDKPTLFHLNSPRHPLTGDHIRFLFEDSRHQLWIGANSGELSLFNRSAASFTQVPITSAAETPLLLAMTENSNGDFLFGTENAGLKIWKPGTSTLTSYHHVDNDPNSISANTINGFCKDAKGNIWIATLNGANFIPADAALFRSYAHRQGANELSDDNVIGLYEDTKNNLWIGTDGGGLDRMNRKTGVFTHFKHQDNNPNSICGNFIKTVCEDAHGNIWIGSWGDGISVYDPAENTFRHYKMPANRTDRTSRTPTLSSNNAWHIFKDSKDNIWIGTYGGGLDLYDPASDTFVNFTHTHDSNSISSDYILTILEDKKGDLWIGTDGGGLDRFNPTTRTFQSFMQGETQKSLRNNSVGALLEDKQGFIWVGTNYGLSRFDRTSGIFTTFFTRDGLPNDMISGLEQDAAGNIWISHMNGLSRLDPEKMEFRNFTISDGLLTNEFRAHCHTRDGRIYLGGKNGINEFYPPSTANNPFDPPLVFTNFQVFNKDVPIATAADNSSPLKTTIPFTREITLSYRFSVISFEFASLNYPNRGKNQYAYRLDGFDKEWNFIGPKNNITFTNLDPGDYTLLVKGLTNQGSWSASPSRLHLVITPPFWQTWWFKIGMLLVIATTIGLLFYLRLLSVRKRNRQLEKEIGNRTRQLKEANSFLLERNEEIKLQNEQLEQFNDETNRQKEKILHQQEQIVSQNQALEKTVIELESINQTQNKFFSILAHDLKNPAFALSGIAATLDKEFDRLDRQSIRTQLNSIHRSSAEIYELLINLLDWAITQSGNIQYTPEEINVYDMISKNATLMESQLINKDISLEIHTPLHHTVFGDYQMLDAVLRNLLSNSIKFTHRNGKIIARSEEADGNMILSITDTGIGMTETQVHRLFQPNDHPREKGTEKENGTGLGLIICQEFIEANKGSMKIESQPGKGSSFRISIPKATTVKTAQRPLNAPRNNSLPDTPEAITIAPQTLATIKGRRILIIDDHREIRTYLRLLLSGVFEIFDADNGAQAITLALEYQPEAIISDMMMPEMNGLELCEKIKTNAATSHIPVILLTSRDDEQSQLSGYAAGADVYLTKPIRQHILLQVILNLIKQRETLQKKYQQSDQLYPNDLPLNKLDDEFLHIVTDYVQQHLEEEELNYMAICTLTHMSRSVLYAKLKNLTGQGVHDFIKTIRLKKSIVLLSEGKLSIGQIATRVGFNTASYFTKSFIKQYGMTPREYIGRLRSDKNE